MTTIIAICGTMGSGKSTLSEHAVAAIPNCVTLQEDLFNNTMNRSLDDMDAWWQGGADVGEFDLSAVVEQLQLICPERSDVTSAQRTAVDVIDDARDQRYRSAPEFVLFETQFGRLHPALRPWIDVQCWIDVPADSAVVRKLLQFSTELMQAGRPADQGMAWIAEFCQSYLTTTRKFFDLQRVRVRECADFVIDGTGSPFDVCSRFLAGLPMKDM